MIGEERETCRRDTQLIGEANDGEEQERQASDKGVQEAGEWWGRARDRRVIGEEQETD